MSLQKGFLRPKINLDTLNLDRKKLLIGTAFWLVFSFVVYSFLVCIREIFRYTSIWHDSERFLLLTPTENYFYNFVFAFFACILAFSVITNHWLRRRSVIKDIKRYRKAAIFHDKVSLLWYSIYWLSKMSLVFWTWNSVMGVFTEFSLFPDYAWMFVLLLLNLYLHQWLTIRRVFRNAIISWLLGVFLVIVIISSLFATINVIPYRALNESVLKNTVSYHIKVELPSAINSAHHSRRFILENIYYGFDKTKSDLNPTILVKYFGNNTISITYNELERYINERKHDYDEYHWNEITWRLHIDKHAKMEHVKKLINEFRKLKEYNIQFATWEKAQRGTYGFSRRILLMDVSYKNLSKDDYVVIKIKIRDNQLYLENKEININEFASVMVDSLKQNKDKTVLEIDTDNHSEFQTYLNVCDQFVTVVKAVRNQWIMDNFYTPLPETEFLDEQQQQIYDSARLLFPMSLIDKE